MKAGIRYTCLSAAVAAVLYGDASVYARDLTWDSTGSSAATGGADGDGTWDLTSTNWFDATLTTPVNVKWLNSPPDSARFGLSTTGAGAADTLGVTLGTDITVQNLTIATASTGAFYDFQGNGHTLTIAGNVTKAGLTGGGQFATFAAINLTASVPHTFALRDTGGDLAELTINSPISGGGALTLDNASAGYEQFGTLLLNGVNNYSGGTNINSGRLAITTSTALGTGTTTIANAGSLTFGGGGTLPNAGLALTNAITIKRSDYGSDDAHNKFTDAIIAYNGSGIHTISGAFVVDSTDARVRADTSRITISSNITEGPTVAPGTGVLTLNGDFQGFISLTGNNTGLTGGIRLLNGVQLDVDNELSLGGTGSKLYLSGGTIHPTGALATSAFMTNFGGHDLSVAPINTGVKIDAGRTFTVNGLSGTAIGTRGDGTINYTGTNVFTGVPFFDGGIVNISDSTTLGAFRLRSPVLNVNNGATLTTTGFRATTIGSNSPDSGTVNVLGTGKLLLGNAEFNVSGETITNSNNGTDNNGAGTTGVLNVLGAGTVTVGGDTYFGRSVNTSGTLNLGGTSSFTVGAPGAFRALRIGDGYSTAKGFVTVAGDATLTSNGELYVGRFGGVGTLTQSGGTINANQGGGNSFVVGGLGGSTGTFTKTGGVTNVAGETWIGDDATASSGTFTQSAGSYTGNDWFVVGRNGALGTLDLSGGTITKNGGGNTFIGERNADNTSSITVRGTGTFAVNGGEFWVGQGGGSGVFNVGTAAGQASNADSAASFTVNNWLAVGREGGTGVVNQFAGSVTKSGNGFLTIGGNGVRGTYNQTGGTLVSNNTFIGETGDAIGILNASGGTTTLNGQAYIGRGANANGTLTVSGTADVTGPTISLATEGTAVATINLNGGRLSVDSLLGGVSSGSKTVNFNGGVLRARSDSTTFVENLATNVRAGGAKLDSNGFAVTVNSALLHDAALGTTADGGLAVTGGGGLTLTGVNTYTGPTSVTTSTLALTSTGSINTSTLNSTTAIANDGSLTTRGGGTIASIAGAGTLNLAGGTLNLAGPTLGTLNTQNVVAFSGTGVLDIHKDQIRISGDQYTSLVSNLTAGKLKSSDAQANASTRVVGIRYDGTNTTARYTTYGDSDLNGRFNGTDLALINGANKFGGAAGSATYADGDVNYTGRFNGADLSLINGANSFGTGTIPNVSFAPSLRSLASVASPNAIAVGGPNDGKITLVYDPTSGNLTIANEGIAYGTITLNATSSFFKDGVVGTTPIFYSNDDEIGRDFTFGVLVGQQTAQVTLPGVLDLNLSQDALLAGITVVGVTNGPAASNITFSGGTAATPEPAALAVLALSGATMLRRRRR